MHIEVEVEVVLRGGKSRRRQDLVRGVFARVSLVQLATGDQ